MRNPAYLCQSRHGIFYFRFPLAPRFKASVRLSLSTRDPRLALAISRELVLVASSTVAKIQGLDVTLEELRALLLGTFASYRAKHREAVAANGPMREEELETHEHYVALFDQGKVANVVIERAFDGFLQDKGLSLPKSEPHYAQAVSEHASAARDYRQFTIDHSRSLKEGGPTPEVAILKPVVASAAKLTLRSVLDTYEAEMEREKRGTDKTRKRRSRHMALLCEILGGETDLSKLSWPDSRRVKSTLAALPIHRTKKAQTRNKTLSELLEAPAEAGLHVRTINSHLSSYSGFFHWAKQNGFVTENLFTGLAYNTQNANEEDPRLPFSMDQLARIRDAVLEPARQVETHHKWGTLVAMYLGARLNEVAQLHLSDIVKREGVWCFDINTNDKAVTRKRLKNRQSARIVPVHPYLVSIGFLEYVELLRSRGETRLFPEFPYTASDGYGRNLGRWVNNSLLPDLKLKSEQHTFHSLRHSMVERLVALNVSQAHVMAIVGHEPGTTTLKVYNRNGFPPQQLLDAISGVVIARAPKNADTDAAS